MREFEHGGNLGLFCPWCPGGKTPIHKCPHNPFRLMEEADRWRREAERGQEALEVIEGLGRLLGVKS